MGLFHFLLIISLWANKFNRIRLFERMEMTDKWAAVENERVCVYVWKIGGEWKIWRRICIEYENKNYKRIVYIPMYNSSQFAKQRCCRILQIANEEEKKRQKLYFILLNYSQIKLNGSKW